MSPRVIAVAAARVVEQRLRTSPRAVKLGRKAFAALARISPEVRAYVRLRLMRIV